MFYFRDNKQSTKFTAMKKTTLQIAACLLFIIFIGSCSNDDTSIVSDTATEDDFTTAARSTLWDGIIGTDNGAGVYQITADQTAIKADFEDVLKSEGTSTTLQTLQIVKKVATNDPADSGFMLIGGDNAGISIGVMLEEKVGGNLYLENPLGGVANSTSCRGCTTGCNLEYIKLSGRKVAYCNENGCGEFCEKTETSFH